jgi:hypothetical protein
MRRDFSANSNRLLKDLLMLRNPDFLRIPGVPERGGGARAARFNRPFTMTARGLGAMPCHSSFALGFA